MTETTRKASSPLLIAVAWFIVVVPAGWGLTYTVQSALKIFQTGASARPPAASSAPGSTAVPASK